MKSFLIIGLVAILATYVNAECNNMCSGHGICGVNDMCKCYRNWRGADCSERTCQFGRSFVDTAQGDLNHDGVVEFATDNALFESTTNGNNARVVDGKSPAAVGSNSGVGNYNAENEWRREVRTQWRKSTFELFPPSNIFRDVNHVYMECSNKGVCDRVTGECTCYEGYEGSACQRSICPNDCSGNGVCQNIKDNTQSVASYIYNLWDASKIQACSCDPGYSGIDCSERLCPRGDDPLNPNSQNQVDHVISFSVKDHVSAATGVTQTFSVQFLDSFGETWLSQPVAWTTTLTTDDGLAAALTGIPNNVIPTVSVSVLSDGGTGKKYTVTFTGNPSDLTDKVTIKYKTDLTTEGATAFSVDTVGTKTNEECSSRGLCDYETGICKCFRGYRLADCSGQSALAY